VLSACSGSYHANNVCCRTAAKLLAPSDGMNACKRLAARAPRWSARDPGFAQRYGKPRAQGTHERFIGFLIEHYAGNFPRWLAPKQARVLTISDDEALVKYGKVIVTEFRSHMARAEGDYGRFPNCPLPLWSSSVGGHSSGRHGEAIKP
jgi:hypothetical protein